MTKNFVHALPVIVAAAGLGVCSRVVEPSVLLAMFALLAAAVRFRVPLDAATQRLTLVVLAVLVIAGVRAAGMPLTSPRLGAFGYGFAFAPLLMATVRLFIKAPEGGRKFTEVLALVTVLTCGAARPGSVYIVLFIVFSASWFFSQRTEDTFRPEFSHVSRRAKVFSIAVLLSTATIGLLATLVMRPLHDYMQRRFRMALESRYEEKVGLSENARLGEMKKLLQSSTIVLRISGPRIDRVRGVVLDHYDYGRWTRSAPDAPVTVAVSKGKPNGTGYVEVRHVGGDLRRLFMPLEARELASMRGMIRADAFGSAFPLPRESSPTLWFRLGNRSAAPIAPPHQEDLEVPREARADLATVASSFARGATTPEEALEAIQRELRRNYTYSLEPREQTRFDPVLEFLFLSRSGHCEYFASAFALLARSIGIPARLVLGYRVGERNPMFDHYVVRQKNAHAWVEAYLPSGNWTTFDPTPMLELPQNEPRDETGAEAWFETLSVSWDKLEAWLSERSIFELGGLASIGVVVFGLQRWWRQRRPLRPSVALTLTFDPPPEGWVQLEEELGRRGLAREVDETLTHWAARISMPEVSSAIAVYEEARYGRREDGRLPELLERAKDAVVRSRV